MKIAFIGDTHHNERALKVASKYINDLKSDIVIHLGDCIEDVKLLEKTFKGEIYAVAGNCDFSKTYPKEDTLTINGVKIFFTHGDLYKVKSTMNSIAIKAESIGADVVLFGHTHIPLKEEYRNIIFMNPGSIPKPSPWAKGKYIGFIEIDDEGVIVAAELKAVEV
ncbi:metallophosphoesterase [Clostridium sp. UBA5119]|uniref:metallophosphoesterase family protein n=1 Tax=Clostridium sp. UBA5119 TaxID=1946366 RepID=UPI003216E9C1